MDKKLEQVLLSKYFYENMHLLGFDKHTRVINTVIRELVDNSIDACLEAEILPELELEIKPGSKGKSYLISLKDNGPALPEKKIPEIAGKLLYGSKFGANTPSRGQQGLGLTAIIMYAQKSTGLPVTITSKTREETKATRYVLEVDIENNQPKIISKETLKVPYTSGITVELQVGATYIKNGLLSTPELIKRYIYLNPFMSLRFLDPFGVEEVYPRLTEELPRKIENLKKIPHHQQVGSLKTSFNESKNLEISILELLTNQYYGSEELYAEVLNKLGISGYIKAGELCLEELELILEQIKSSFNKILPPEGLVTLLNKAITLSVTKNYSVHYDHVVSKVSKPIFYNAGVLQVEACAFYGGPNLLDDKIQVQRVANCAPLTYQASSCVITKAILDQNWKDAGLTQSQNELPRGPLLVLVHVSGSKVPYSSPSKDAIAEHPEIYSAIKSCLSQICKSIKTHRSKELLQAAKDEKILVITRVLPEIIRLVEKGIDRKLRIKSLKTILSSIIEGLMIIEGKQELEFVNGGKDSYEFELGTPGLPPEQYIKIQLQPGSKRVVPMIKDYFIEGLTPLEYNVIDKKIWDNLKKEE